MKKITVLGGGTGTYVVLSGLKKYNLDLAAIVSMMDSGGSTGRLRDQLEVLPPGDLRQCLVALSEAPELWRKLFLYRFEKGDLKGHNFGNIFLSALEKVSDDYATVIDTANYVLQTKGQVIPVTLEKTHLAVQYESGVKLKGEGIIDEDNPERSRIVKANLEPQAKANKDAIDRIAESDYIIVGPGDLYTSIIPVLLVDNIRNAIKKSKAKIIYILNLMTKAGQTTNYTGMDFLQDITAYLGREPDYIIGHKGSIPQFILDWYESHTEHPVKIDINKDNFKGTIIEDDVISRTYTKTNSADELTRSILRHDSEKLTEIITKLI
ncbi:MAG TPA: YvcK family protein [Candidatus Woesebacteria bacterium]|nr:YvcK family protein [Candidatus Woesebacteria bacterium]